MKKVLSVILSAIILISACAVSLSVFATNSPVATVIPDVEVDSRPTTEVDIVFDKDNPNQLTITYNGNREVIKWENNLNKLGLVENTDYVIKYNGGTNSSAKSITVTLCNAKAIDTWNSQKPYFNIVTKCGSLNPDKDVNIGITGSGNGCVTWEINPKDPNEIIIHYTGDGIVSDWKTNLDAIGLKEGVDYILKTSNNKTILSIKFLTQAGVDSWNNGQVKVEAVVNKGNTTKATPPTAQRPVINTSPTSPHTGNTDIS